jgi:hypothetical protein
VQFTTDAHDAIANGDITVTYRFWKRPQVKVGGRYAVGRVEIEVDSMELVPFGSIAARDVKRAGSPNRAALRALVAHAGPVADDTLVFQIEFHVTGPRRARSVAVTQATVANAHTRLDRLDRAARRGPWTREVLALIGTHPAVVSTELAAMLGRPRPDFKQDVRKLKAIGLTESLEVGYRLTPLGEAVVDSHHEPA